jgi:ribosomal protein L7/L12
MKITLTHAEAVTAIRAHFNFPSEATIIIQEEYDGPYAHEPEFIRGRLTVYPSNLSAWDFLDTNSKFGGNKISAIKELRAQTNYSLKEAKDAIETWEAFSARAKMINRWPTADGYHTTSSGYSVTTFK